MELSFDPTTAILTLNLVVVFLLGVLTLGLASGFDQSSPKGRTFLRGVAIGWMLNAAYLLVEILRLGSLVHALLPISVSNLGSLAMLAGAYVFLTTDWIKNVTLAAIVLIPAVLAFGLNQSLNSAPAIEAPWLVVACSIGISIVAAVATGIGYSKLISDSAGYSSKMRMVVTMPIYGYAVLQLLYFGLFLGSEEIVAACRTLGFVAGPVLKLTHGWGFLHFAVNRIRALEKNVAETVLLEKQKKFIDDTAHELMTPVSELHLNADLLDYEIRTKGNIRVIAEAMSICVRNIASVVFAASETLRNPEAQELPLERSRVSANHLCELAILSVKRTRKEPVRIDDSFSADTYIEVAAWPIMQALVNILKNAFDAIGPLGGQILVSTTRKIGPRSAMHSSTPTTVIIEISDSGPGIPESETDKIWDWGYTTKEESGNGIGLFLVKTSIAQEHGRVYSSNRPTSGASTGATFTIELPYSPKLKTEG